MSPSILLVIALQASTPALDADYRANNCTDPQNQAEMNICAGIDFARADLDLNAAYRDAIAGAQANDRERSAVDRESDTRPGYEAVLRAAQRAWLTYRDQHCTWQGYNDARGGSMEALVYNGCRASVTRARVEELRGGQRE